MYLIGFYCYHIFTKIPVFNANIVDPEQLSDLGLHCLPMSLFWMPGRNGLTFQDMEKMLGSHINYHSL